MDDTLIHLIATGGNGIATLACLGCIWLCLDLRRSLAELRTDQVETAKDLAELRGEIRGGGFTGKG